MITASQLKLHTVKDLAEMAKRKGIPGWHAMRKQQLVDALVRSAKRDERKRGTVSKGAKSGDTKTSRRSEAKSKQSSTGRRIVESKIESSKPAASQSGPARNGKAKRGVAERSAASQSKTKERRKSKAGPAAQPVSAIPSAKIPSAKDLARADAGNGKPYKDRLVVMVRDAYWIQAWWEISKSAVERARVALAQNWHLARPVLRLWEIQQDGTSRAERVLVRDIEIDGRANHWYVHVGAPDKTYSVDIGYAASDGRFFCLARGNSVTTPPAHSADVVDLKWSGIPEDFDRIYALSGGYEEGSDTNELREVLEERLQRPMGGSVVSRFGPGVDQSLLPRPHFLFQIDAELTLFGRTLPNYSITVRGEPIEVEPDGSFSIRIPLPDKRHVLPIVAVSADGFEERTIVVAVERNTKIMEPVVREMES